MVNVEQLLEKEIAGPLDDKFQVFPSRFSTLIISFKRMSPLSYKVILRERDSDFALTLELSSELVQLFETEKEILVYERDTLHVVKKGKAGFYSFKCPLPNYGALHKQNFSLLPVGRLLLEEGTGANHNFQMRLLIDSSVLRKADFLRRMVLESHQNHRFRAQPEYGLLVAKLGSRYLSLQQSNFTLTDHQSRP